MVRGLAHASLLFAVAHLPGGRRGYHAVTRGLLRSQERVSRKLQRVWPGYARLWRERCGLALDEAAIWVHEPGWVPFAPLASYLLTGRGGIVTSASDHPSDRHVGTAVQAALGAGFEVDAVMGAPRRAHVASLAGDTAAGLLRATGTQAIRAPDPARVPLPAGAADLCHSGGVLERYQPALLEAFLREGTARSGGHRVFLDCSGAPGPRSQLARGRAGDVHEATTHG